MINKTPLLLSALAVVVATTWIAPAAVAASAAPSAVATPARQADRAELKRSSRRVRVKATGETGRRVEEARKESAKKMSSYKRWKMRLPFWQRKALLLTELATYITIGVVCAQMIEVGGLMKYFAWLTWPVIKLGRLGPATSPAFVISVQSGAIANSMLVSARDEGEITNRQLYTSVLVVSCLSLFAHLPTFVLPIGMAFGTEATVALFSVRFAAIFVEIIVILLVSNLLIYPWIEARKARSSSESNSPNDANGEGSGDSSGKTSGEDAGAKVAGRRRRGPQKFWPAVWSRSRRTMTRLMIYLIPSFAIMASFEYYEVFKLLAAAVPSVCSLSFLPPEAAVIIPAQAVSLYNGAILAGNAIDANAITVKQAVFIIFAGSLITAPIRTAKHALPTYVAILGPKAGLIMAFSAQLIRSIFLLMFVVLLWFVWQV